MKSMYGLWNTEPLLNLQFKQLLDLVGHWRLNQELEAWSSYKRCMCTKGPHGHGTQPVPHNGTQDLGHAKVEDDPNDAIKN